jgi:hypothetical protein
MRAWRVELLIAFCMATFLYTLYSLGYHCIALHCIAFFRTLSSHSIFKNFNIHNTLNNLATLLLFIVLPLHFIFHTLVNLEDISLVKFWSLHLFYFWTTFLLLTIFYDILLIWLIFAFSLFELFVIINHLHLKCGFALTRVDLGYSIRRL